MTPQFDQWWQVKGPQLLLVRASQYRVAEEAWIAARMEAQARIKALEAEVKYLRATLNRMDELI